MVVRLMQGAVWLKAELHEPTQSSLLGTPLPPPPYYLPPACLLEQEKALVKSAAALCVLELPHLQHG